MQVMFVSFKDYCMKSAFVYIRETPSQEQIKILKNDLSNIDLVMGDLNLDPNRSPDAGKLETLSSGRSSILNEITTTRFNQLDHILLNCKKFKIYFATSFINYTTDHHLLSSRIAKNGNEFNTAFLQKLSFDVDKDTKHKSEGKTGYFDAKPKSECYEERSKKQKDQMHTEKQKEVDLTCLFSPNWLDDEVINKYLKLLNSKDSGVFMYSTFFHTAFTEGGFERVERYYRSYDVLSYRVLFIPVHHGNHWFLITFDGKELVSFDPYNYPGANGLKKKELLEENKRFHRSILTKLKHNYFEPLYKKNNRQCESIEVTVKLPPQIPAQENNHDCGVFLITFAKYLVFNKEFDFHTGDMIGIRETIRQEMQLSQIYNDFSQSRPPKTKSSQNRNPKPKKKMKKQDNIQRRIINPGAETCWLNSCLQLVLTALDFKTSICPTGSVLWQTFLWLQGKDSSVDLDPTDVKLAILQTEQKRIVTQNVAQSHTLFDLGNLPLSATSELRIKRIGQQDCKDFFFCLDENREAWPDVFNLFKIQTLNETECASCGHTSRQEVSGNERTFITLTCPSENVNMKDYVEEQMNGFNVVEDWRDEDGCGDQTRGRSRTRISNLEDIQYVIFVLERLIRVDQRLHIMKTTVNVNQDEEVNLMDMDGKVGKFEAMAIIHHSGNVIGQTTQGHYRADVKNKETLNWFRTSDNEPPESLTVNGLTKMGYIFLYKKSNSVSVNKVSSNSPKDVPMDRHRHFNKILNFLDEMNMDLVFNDFDDLTYCEDQWILNLESCSLREIGRCIDLFGKR